MRLHEANIDLLRCDRRIRAGRGSQNQLLDFDNTSQWEVWFSDKTLQLMIRYEQDSTERDHFAVNFREANEPWVASLEK